MNASPYDKVRQPFGHRRARSPFVGGWGNGGGMAREERGVRAAQSCRTMRTSFSMSSTLLPGGNAPPAPETAAPLFARGPLPSAEAEATMRS